MKPSPSPFIRSLLSVALLLCFAPFAITEEQPAKTPDPWEPMRILLGKWEGDSQSEPGTGKAVREYAFTLNNRFIEVRNRSTYPPQEKNPKGEVHEDRGMMSYDRAAKKLVLRQFHVEGFVNHYVLDSVSPDGRTIVFITAAIENIVPDWRGRETYTVTGDDTFPELFEMSAPGKEFEKYVEIHFRRVKS